MLEQSYGLLFHQLLDHVAENGSDGVEPLISLADVIETHIVHQDLLNNENGHCLAQLRPSLHDAQTERNDLSSEQEVDDLGRIVLHQRANDAQRCETEIFERS